MAGELELGITPSGVGTLGRVWNILGQTYYPKAVSGSSFAFEVHMEAGQFVPVHIHTDQDEFIHVLDGAFELKLNGEWSKAGPGDLVRMPMGIPHGIFNKTEQRAKAMFWVAPSGSLEQLFEAIDGVGDPEEVVRISAGHNVNFLPPEANA